MAKSPRPNSAVRPGRKAVEPHWDPARCRRNAGFVAVLGEPLLVLPAPCARGLAAEVVDGTRLAFAAELDAVFSNAAVHWLGDPDAVIAGVWRALKPGGRFVAECGGAGNIEAVRHALTTALARRGIDGEVASLWYFPAPEECRARLERRGFVITSMALFPRPTPLPGSLGDWLDTFAESFLASVPPQTRPNVGREVQDMLDDRLADTAGAWTTDDVRLRFSALKPAEAAP